MNVILYLRQTFLYKDGSFRFQFTYAVVQISHKRIIVIFQQRSHCIGYILHFICILRLYKYGQQHSAGNKYVHITQYP